MDDEGGHLKRHATAQVKHAKQSKKAKKLPPLITAAMQSISLTSGPVIHANASPLTPNSSFANFVGDMDETEDTDDNMKERQGLLKRGRNTSSGENSSDEAEKKKPHVMVAPLISAAYKAITSQFKTNQELTSEAKPNDASLNDYHDIPSVPGTSSTAAESASTRFGPQEHSAYNVASSDDSL
jgi:hypothetical protein